MNVRIQRGAAASTSHRLLKEFVSGRGQHQGSGASQLKWDWHGVHASICGSLLPPGNAKYEKVLKEAKEKMAKDSQRAEAVALGEAAAAEPPRDDADTAVRSPIWHVPPCPCVTRALGTPQQASWGPAGTWDLPARTWPRPCVSSALPQGLPSSGCCPSSRCTSSPTASGRAPEGRAQVTEFPAL